MAIVEWLWHGVRRWRRRLLRPAVVRAGADDAPATLELAEHRLRRIADMCRTGDVAGAELDLHDWMRHEDCPATALTLLAALLARRGQTDQARQVLCHRRRLRVDDDLGVGRLLTAVLIELDMPDAAGHAAAQVHEHHGHDPAVGQWVSTFEARAMPSIARSSVDRLATELVADPDVIPSLVAAARIEIDGDDLALLRMALSRAARELTDRRQALTACQALAELALVAGDNDEARRWAHRGLKLNPYAAPLALVLAQIDDDPAVGPPAVKVLEAVAAQHPNYADLRAALDRRQRQREAA